MDVANPERAFSLGESRATAAARRQNQGEHAPVLRDLMDDLMDTVLGDLVERLAVECDSRMSRDVERATRGDGAAFFFGSNWSNFVSPGGGKYFRPACNARNRHAGAKLYLHGIFWRILGLFRFLNSPDLRLPRGRSLARRDCP